MHCHGSFTEVYPMINKKRHQLFHIAFNCLRITVLLITIIIVGRADVTCDVPESQNNNFQFSELLSDEML